MSGVKVLLRGADRRGAWACYAAYAPSWSNPHPSRTLGTFVIEQQDGEIGRLRDDLARHKGVNRENGRLQRRNHGMQRQIERLERENEHLKQQLGAERRAGRRQAAPFAKKRPQGRGGRPGRRPGARYGRQGRRPCPARVDETIAAPAPTSCPDCGGAVEVTGAAAQYQEDLPPVRPLVRRLDIEVGHCSACRRRIQGRHALQTSDALGAARAQLGPGVVALVVELHTHGGLPLAKVADLLQTRFGLQVTPGGLANLLHRAARDARPAYEALREQVRNAPVVTADETGWRVGARSHWLWAAVTPTTQAALEALVDPPIPAHRSCHVKAETASAVHQAHPGPAGVGHCDEPAKRQFLRPRAALLGPQNDIRRTTSVTHRLALPHKGVAAAIETVRASGSGRAVSRRRSRFWC